MFNSILVIGLGLIGGSFAKAAKKAGVAKEIIGYSRDVNTTKQAFSDGAIDKICEDIAATSREVDLILIASPLASYSEIAKKIAKDSKAIITDVGSLKAAVNNKILDNIGDKKMFVPAHPIAGSEKSGFANADENLFAQKKLIITPLEFTDAEAIRKTKEMWQKIGAVVTKISADLHDDIYAKVSHMPQLLSYAVLAAYKENNWLEKVKNINDGQDLKDGFFRLTASNPDIWRDILNLNQCNINSFLKIYLKRLYEVCIEYGAENNTAAQNISSDSLNIYVPAILGKTLLELTDENILLYAGSGLKTFTSLASKHAEIPAASKKEIAFVMGKIILSIDKFSRFIEDDLIQYFSAQVRN